ncbi:MAG: hypothetical protein N2376_10785 [Clostridia bacterium]|nr:hypothetical protein [Clostridia bacterium]
MVPRIVLGTYYLPEETIFEGVLTGLAEYPYKLLQIVNCYLYDISFEQSILDDAIEFMLDFTLEVIYKTCLKDKTSVQTSSKKHHAQKSITLAMPFYRDLLTLIDGKTRFVHHLSELSFKTTPVDEGAVQLTVQGTLDGVALADTYHNFWVLKEEKWDREKQLPKPEASEAPELDWKTLLDSVNIKDVVTLFENLMVLIKNPIGSEEGHCIADPKLESGEYSVSNDEGAKLRTDKESIDENQFQTVMPEKTDTIRDNQPGKGLHEQYGNEDKQQRKVQPGKNEPKGTLYGKPQNVWAMPLKHGKGMVEEQKLQVEASVGEKPETDTGKDGCNTDKIGIDLKNTLSSDANRDFKDELSEIMNRCQSLEELNQSLYTRLKAASEKLAHYRGELKDRNYVIGGLLEVIKNNGLLE